MMRSLLICLVFPALAACLVACENDDAAVEVPHDGHASLHQCGEPVPVADQDVGPKDLVDEVGEPILPPKIIDWMSMHKWQRQHFAWHTVRLIDRFCPGVDWSKVTDRNVALCKRTEMIFDRGLWREPLQSGAPGDGYIFFAMHRHMLRTLRQAFPEHLDLFEGFKHIPLTKDDPENPMPGRDIVWSEPMLEAIDKLEHLEDHLDEFPTEDDLGRYIESSAVWTEANPAQPKDPTGGLHFALHIQFSVIGSPLFSISSGRNIESRSFWKLHGWIDNVWQKYRDLKEIPEDDRPYVEALLGQCEEMHALGKAIEEGDGKATGGGESTPPQGYFAEKVAPIFNHACSSCHDDMTQNNWLFLGPGSVEEVVGGLVNVSSREWPDMMLIAPGDPDKSFLFHKIAGTQPDPKCEGLCSNQMPQGRNPLSADEIDIVRTWILDGAKME